jgi:multidrug transporter EmrE-like cation transporter
VNPLALATIGILLSVAAQFALKTGMSGAEIKAVLAEPLGIRALLAILTDKYVLLGFLLYGSGAIVWLGVLSKWDVSKAYPMVGLGFALTVLIGFILGESVSPSRIAGVALICAGVVLVARS